MIVRGLILRNYRNYKALAFEPHERLTVLLGENAQGKTNALEAVYLCATGKSHRKARDAELVRFDAEGAYVKTELTRSAIDRRIEIKMLKNGRKQILVDGASIRRMGELMGCLNAVMFAPEELSLVKDGPGERRRYMDVLLCQTDPVYFYALTSYQRALAQRNALLKTVAAGRASAGELDVWDEQLTRFSCELTGARSAAMQRISEDAARFHGMITGNGESMKAAYKPDPCGDELAEWLAANRDDDIRRGATSRGPHRDDIALTIDGCDARAFGSQGQQRTAALALKLAELPYIESRSGEKPVLLLDDVLSELDESRQKLMLTVAAEYQTILTCAAMPKKLPSDAVWRVRAGDMERVR